MTDEAVPAPAPEAAPALTEVPAPAAEPEAATPAAPVAEATEPATEAAPAEAPALEATPVEAPPATPVTQVQASNEAVTPEHESVALEDDPLIHEEVHNFLAALRSLCQHVRDGRRAGDHDVEAALAVVERHL